MRQLLFFLSLSSLGWADCPIRGVVRDRDTGQPIRQAGVFLGQQPARDKPDEPRPWYQTVTATDGTFSFCGIPPAAYSLSTVKPGYLRVPGFGVGPDISDTWLRVSGNHEFPDVTLKLIRASRITGRLVSRTGEPLPATKITLLTRSSQPSGPHFLVHSTATSDSRGEYRFDLLLPGNYFLRVDPQSRPKIPPIALLRPDELAFATPADALAAYYPGVDDIGDGQPVAVKAGSDMQLPDFPIPMGRLARVLIHLNGLADKCTQDSVLEFFALGPSPLGRFKPTVERLGPDLYIWSDAPPGKVTFSVGCDASAHPRQADIALTLTDVDQDITLGLTELRPIPVIYHRDAGHGLINFREVGSDVYLNPDRPSGSADCFILDYLPGEYAVESVKADNDTYLQALVIDGVPSSNFRFRIEPNRPPGKIEVVFRTGTGTISGKLTRNPRGATAGQHLFSWSSTVYVIAADASVRRYNSRSRGADEEGNYAISGLAPGQYLVFATPPVDPNDLSFDTALARYGSRATSITIKPGEDVDLDLDPLTVP